MKYLLSIITPCHNAKSSMLERAFDSLREQTVGFENIEWVVVNHNDDECAVNQIRTMTESFPNVSAYVLNDGYTAPATPRNYGLERATGEYVGFLDQDDWFEPDAFEKVLRHIKEADMASFQFHPVCADDGVQTVPPFSLLDGRGDVIEMEPDTWDSSLFMHIMALGIWTKVYRREFIEKHNLRFDGGVHFCDDALFNIECFHRAKRICFLPNHVGYNYFLHENSTVQNTNKTPEQIVNYAAGFATTFARGLSYGLYMNGVIWGYLCYQSALMIVSSDLSLRKRMRIRRMLSPYLKTEQMESDYAQKSFVNDCKDMYRFSKAVIGHPILIHLFVFLMRIMKVDLASKLKGRQQY